MVEAPLPPAPSLNLKKTQKWKDIAPKEEEDQPEKDQNSQAATDGSQPSPDADAGQAHDTATQQQEQQEQEQQQVQEQAPAAQPLLISSACSTAPFTAATGMRPSSQLRLLRASTLARSMDACGWVRLCGEDAVCPWEWLREALRDSVQDLINNAATDQLVGRGGAVLGPADDHPCSGAASSKHAGHAMLLVCLPCTAACSCHHISFSPVLRSLLACCLSCAAEPAAPLTAGGAPPGCTVRHQRPAGGHQHPPAAGGVDRAAAACPARTAQRPGGCHARQPRRSGPPAGG